MSFKRLLILQLDSVPWAVLDPLLEDGSMPFLAGLRREGSSGTLRSTIPPITPAAWTSFMTGVAPGRHGVLHFKGFDPRQNCYRLSDSRHLQDRNLYHFFSQGGLRVGVVMQPGLHPPFAVNGFLLTGFDSPGVGSAFAYPSQLEQEILEICPEHSKNFNLHKTWLPKAEGAEIETAVENLRAASAQVRRVSDLALALAGRHPVDVLSVYLQAPDVIFHKLWRYCIPGESDESPIRKQVVEFFRDLDRACSDLAQALPAEDRLDLVLSDHGHQFRRHSVFVNRILKDAGLIRYARSWYLLKDGWRRFRDFSKGIRRKGLGIPVDWDHTRAFLPYQACSGFVYVNLQGRQPFGSVPLAEYATVRDQTMALLKAHRLPDGSPTFEAVLSGDELFPDKDTLGLPDIVLLQGSGVDIKRRAGAGPQVQSVQRLRLGIHHPDGMYILRGAGVVPARDRNAQILDLAPTLLAALGQPVPSYMEGQVLQACFERPMDVQRREWAWEQRAPAQTLYSASEEAMVEQRLADLGYVD